MRAASQVEDLRQVVSLDPSPETLAMNTQSGRTVKDALALIPAEQRLALEMSFFAGLSHAEIAEQLGQPLGTDPVGGGKASGPIEGLCMMVRD